MKSLFVLMFIAGTSAFAADIPPGFTVFIDTGSVQFIEGQPATLTLRLQPSSCPGFCFPPELPLNSQDVVTWSFGDGTAGATVTGVAHVTHSFPRGWFDLKARHDSITYSTRVFVAAAPPNPPSYIDLVSVPYTISETTGAWVVKLGRSGN